MVKSMTGYGRARATRNLRDITVEVRSVNNRYLDCTVKMSRMYAFAEAAVKGRVQKAVSRGKVDVFITVDAMAADTVQVSVNTALAAQYAEALKALAAVCGTEERVTPEQLADYWGLAGISSSKVPGVAGIGPKSAAQLLNEFQDLEGLYARLAEVPEKWRKKLAAHQEMAFTCREVARLQTDLQLDGNLQQLRLTR